GLQASFSPRVLHRDDAAVREGLRFHQQRREAEPAAAAAAAASAPAALSSGSRRPGAWGAATLWRLGGYADPQGEPEHEDECRTNETFLHGEAPLDRRLKPVGAKTGRRAEA